MTSWFESTQVAGASTGACAASADSIEVRIAARLPRAREEVEVEGGVQLVRPQVAREPLGVGQPDLADEHARLGVAVGDRAPAAVDVVQLVPVDERVLAGRARRVLLGELRILDEQRRRVDAHARDAAVEPEAQHVLVLEPDVGVRPVEVGLLGREQVEVPLAGRPSSSAVRVQAEPPKIDCQPFGGSSPCSPVPGRNQKRARSGEPGGEASAARNHGCWSETWFGTMSTIVRMPSARASAISCSASLERAEGGVDRAVVGDVVAGVGQRRRVPGVEPEGVDAEVAEVGQPVEDAGQVADPVAVGVGEAADVDLVDDGVAPPPARPPERTSGRGSGAVVVCPDGFTRRKIAHSTIECKT